MGSKLSLKYLAHKSREGGRWDSEPLSAITPSGTASSQPQQAPESHTEVSMPMNFPLLHKKTSHRKQKQNMEAQGWGAGSRGAPFFIGTLSRSLRRPAYSAGLALGPGLSTLVSLPLFLLLSNGRFPAAHEVHRWALEIRQDTF